MTEDTRAGALAGVQVVAFELAAAAPFASHLLVSLRRDGALGVFWNRQRKRS